MAYIGRSRQRLERRSRAPGVLIDACGADVVVSRHRSGHGGRIHSDGQGQGVQCLALLDPATGDLATVVGAPAVEAEVPVPAEQAARESSALAHGFVEHAAARDPTESLFQAVEKEQILLMTKTVTFLAFLVHETPTELVNEDTVVGKGERGIGSDFGSVEPDTKQPT